LTLCF